MIHTVASIATAYDLRPRTVITAIKAGAIPASKSGKVWLIEDTTEDFKAWLHVHRRHQKKPVAPAQEQEQEQEKKEKKA